jgi:hypothetical protein
LWAESYQREFQGILSLQSEVARAIVQEIRVKVKPREEARLSHASVVDPRAHEAYLLGRHHLQKLTREGTEKAIEYFSKLSPKLQVMRMLMRG